jgi:hypothetical protein
VEEELD